MSSVTLSFTRLVLGLLALASLGATAVVPASAAGVTGAVPGEVVRYIADGLIEDLDEFYGLGIDGSGTDFTEATAVGATRVFSFTDDFLAGNAEEPAVRRLNEWVTVVTVGTAPADQVPVGVALVSIDPVTVSPQLSSFTASADFGTVIAALPETATLVRDAARSAWFSLDGETPETRELTPLVSGTSRVTEPIALAEYRDVVANWPTSEPSAREDEPTTRDGLILVGLAVMLIVLLVAVEAFLPSWRRRAKAKAEADADSEPETAAEPEPEPDSEPEPEAEPTPTAKPRAKAKPKPEPEPAQEPEPTPTAKPRAKPKPRPKPQPEPEPAPEPTPTPKPRATPTPKPRAKPKPKPKPEPEPEIEASADPDAG